ncbi:lamin tail domain-containing protein [Streptomyces sp. NPDC002133]|uniref:lamin tail domain-containing protein n=1 Tax=Streptomyces sp. NPDC002133 TaxID=3154409 RepID=UPI00331C4069
MSASRITTARRLVAAVLASGAVVAAAAVPASADGGRDGRHHRSVSPVVISKVQADSPGRDTRSNHSLNAEWVEVSNTGRRAVNLRGWTLTDEDGQRYRFNLRLDGRSTVRIHTGEGRDTRRDVFQDRRNHVWDNDRGTATLRDDRGRVIDTESWGRHHRGGRH